MADEAYFNKYGYYPSDLTVMQNPTTGAWLDTDNTNLPKMPDTGAKTDYGALDTWFGSGKEGEKGIFGPVAGGVGALTNAWLGLQNLKLGKDQFGFAKDSFNTNLANQAALTNARSQDRGRATISQRTGQPVSDADMNAWMQDRRVSGAPV